MKAIRFTSSLLGLTGTLLLNLDHRVSTARAFEGRIQATLTRGSETQTMLFTVGTNQIRIERVETNWPHAINIFDLDTGAITLLFPHNRSFVRLKNEMGAHAPPRVPADAASAGVVSAALPTAPGAGALPVPQMPPGIGPTNLPGMPAPPVMPQMPAMPVGVGPQTSPGTPTMPAMRQIPQMPPGVGPQPGMAGRMPAMPMMPMEQAELKATDQTTNLLGYKCTRYELKQRGEVMEIWATDKLPPFQPYLPNQPPRFGPRLVEEQWGDMLKAKKFFPLLSVLKFENGPERMRFEVKAITPEKIKKEDAAKLFQPPVDYQEIRPLPF